MILRYSLPLLFAAVLPVLDSPLGYQALWIVPLIVAALLTGSGASIEKAPNAENGRIARLIPKVFVAALLVLMLWGAAEAASPERSVAGFLALAAALGVVSGIFGLVAAHELIHSRNAGERIWGEVLLAALSYRHFSISHIHGHHRFAATPDDPGTARRGESAYRFLARTIFEQWLFAWRFERRRLAGRTPVANRCYQNIAFAVVLYGVLFVALGWRAAAMQALVSVIAIGLLEMFNYVAHYGMERRIGDSGRREPLAPHHSWNTGGVLANSLLLNMGRHSDHHRRPQASYEGLMGEPAAPDLPGGYAGAILMALLPPLWMACAHRRLDALRP